MGVRRRDKGTDTLWIGWLYFGLPLLGADVYLHPFLMGPMCGFLRDPLGKDLWLQFTNLHNKFSGWSLITHLPSTFDGTVQAFSAEVASLLAGSFFVAVVFKIYSWFPIVESIFGPWKTYTFVQHNLKYGLLPIQIFLSSLPPSSNPMSCLWTLFSCE